jgi:hypothetical protein
MKHRNTIPHDNYVTKMQQMWSTGALPRDVGVHQVSVSHDDWCGIWQQQRCNCDPDITLKWTQADVARN